MKYAVIQTGGKQYQVYPGQEILVEQLGVKEGEEVEIEKVLFISDDGKIKTGQPFVPGAKVVARSQGEVKGDKVIVFKFKPKTRYHRKRGHRQVYTKLVIERIIDGGEAG